MPSKIKLDDVASNKKVANALEKLYLILFAVLFFDTFRWTAMVPKYWVIDQWIPAQMLLALIILKLFLFGRKTPVRSLLCGILAFVFVMIYKNTGDIARPVMAFLVLGAMDVSFRKIVTIYASVGIPFLFFCIIASQIGLIPDLVYDMTFSGRGLRHSFGIIFPTDFAAHVTYLILAYAWLRGPKLSWIEIALFGLCSWAVKYYCDARTGFICLLLFTVLCLMTKLYTCIKNNQVLAAAVIRKIDRANDLIKICCSYSIVIFSTIMIVLTSAYSDSEFMQKMNRLFSNRLSLGKTALDQYGVLFLGQHIPMQGAGYSETKTLDYYFFVDCSYIKMLVCYGILMSLLIWGCYTLLGRRALKANDVYLIWVLGIVGLQCSMEHHIIEIAYNPFLLAVFAKWEDENEKLETNEFVCAGTV